MVHKLSSTAGAHAGAVAHALCCCADATLACIDSIVLYINMYAFSQIAISGDSFVSSSKQTFTLMRRKGLDAVMMDSILQSVLMLGALAGQLQCCAHAAAYARQ